MYLRSAARHYEVLHTDKSDPVGARSVVPVEMIQASYFTAVFVSLAVVWLQSIPVSVGDGNRSVVVTRPNEITFVRYIVDGKIVSLVW